MIRAFMISFTSSWALGWTYKHFVADKRKQAYADFYKDYNAEAEADRLYRMGLIRGYQDNEDQPDEGVFHSPYIQ